MIISVPPIETQPWPTLGPQVCDWIETYLVHGPGDLRGQPARLDDEKRALIYRAYEVYPEDFPEVTKRGRRRFRRIAWSLRKGSAKTELAAWLAGAELAPDSPVRCGGWHNGEPQGEPVTDPFIPLMAYTEEQSEELAYGALRVILAESSIARRFDVGLQRIKRLAGDGEAKAVAAAPDARDGARMTWMHFDETHRFVLPRHHEAHRVMLANLPKRRQADSWALETTTAYTPGEGSVAEDTHAYATAVLEGRQSDSRLFFFHRQAGEHHDLSTPEGRRAAVLEASGPVASWSNVDGILEQWEDPRANIPYLRRVWLNQHVQAQGQGFNLIRWAELAQPSIVPPKTPAVLGFKATAASVSIVGTEIATGYQWLVKSWRRPEDARADTWEAPQADVAEAITTAFARWQVWRLYADPVGWDVVLASLGGQLGEKKVIAWRTAREAKFALACRVFADAIAAGSLTHDGSPVLASHVGAVRRRELTTVDEQGVPLWVAQKERPDSPGEITAAVAAILSWDCRRDALAEGVGRSVRSMYEDGDGPTEEDIEGSMREQDALIVAALAGEE